MSNTMLAIVVMLASAAMYGLSFVLQHKGTQAALAKSGGKGGFKHLVSNPIWLIGIILFGTAFLLHLVALKFGSVAVVQPLIVTELIFIPPFSALISHAKISGKDWLAIIAVTVGLAGFLIIAAPTEGINNAPTSAWITVIVLYAVVMGALYGSGSRLGLVGRAALFGLAAGLANALLAVVAKGAFGASAVSFFTNPLVWITVLLCVVTVGTTALAFSKGPITISSPAMIAINPIASTLTAMWLFQVSIRHSPLAIVGIIVCMVIINIGIVILSRSESGHGVAEEEAALSEEVTEAVTRHHPKPS